LSGCGSSHEVRIAKDRARTPFVRCDNYGGSTIFLRGPVGSQVLGNNGGSIRENPNEVEEPIGEGPRTIQEERAERAGLEGAIPPAPSSADQLSPIWKKLGLGLGESEHEPGFCPGCRAIIRVGQSPCPRCGADIDWE